MLRVNTISSLQRDIYGLKNSASNKRSAPSRCNRLIQKGQKYSDESSIHGIRYFAGSDKAHIGLRIIWLVIFCISVALGLVVFEPIWRQYSSMATQTSIDFIEQDKFHFPSITFRNLNSFRKSLIGGTYESFLYFTQYDHDVYVAGKQSCSAKTLGELALGPSSKSREYFDFIVANASTLTNTLSYLGIVMISSSTSINSVHMCRFQGRTLNDEECYSAFQNRITSHGYVFTFNPAKVISDYSITDTAKLMGVDVTRRQDSTFPAPVKSLVNYAVKSRGRATAVEFLLNAQEHDLCNAGVNDGAGFDIQVHARDVQPVINELMENIIQLTPGKEITIAIKEVHTVRETESSGRCTSRNDLDYFRHLQHYDQNACFTECLSKKIKAKCDCVPEFAPSAAFIEVVKMRSTLNLTEEKSRLFYPTMLCARPEKRMCANDLITTMIVDRALSKQCPSCKTPCFQKNYVVEKTENLFPADNAFHIYRDHKYPKTNYTALMSLRQVSGSKDAIDILRFTDARTYNLSTEFVSIGETRNSLIYLRIQLEDMNIMVTRETFAVSISELFTQLGGAIGLFIGASVLSFMEFFYWILMPESLRNKAAK